MPPPGLQSFSWPVWRKWKTGSILGDSARFIRFLKDWRCPAAFRPGPNPARLARPAATAPGCLGCANRPRSANASDPLRCGLCAHAMAWRRLTHRPAVAPRAAWPGLALSPPCYPQIPRTRRCTPRHIPPNYCRLPAIWQDFLEKLTQPLRSQGFPSCLAIVATESNLTSVSDAFDSGPAHGCAM